MRRFLNTNIYIGSLKDANNRDLIKENDIVIVLNVCNDIDTPIYNDITLVKWGLDDPAEGLAKRNDVERAACVLSLCSDVAEQRDGNVLVHCHAGNNRSALVAAIYAVNYLGFTLQDAVDAAKVKDNKNWMKDLGYFWS